MNKPVAYGMLTFCKNCGEQNPYAVKELTDEEKIKKLETENDALRKTVDSLFAGLDSSINLNKAQAERRVKELTDEEIEELARKMGMHLYDYEIDSLGNCLNFARAILRKAQEK